MEVQQQEQKQILRFAQDEEFVGFGVKGKGNSRFPCGNDRQKSKGNNKSKGKSNNKSKGKSKGKSKSNGKGNGNTGSFALLRMTNLFESGVKTSNIEGKSKCGCFRCPRGDLSQLNPRGAV